MGIVALRIVLQLRYRTRFRFCSYYVCALAALILIAVWEGWLSDTVPVS